MIRETLLTAQKNANELRGSAEDATALGSLLGQVAAPPPDLVEVLLEHTSGENGSRKPRHADG